MNVTEKQKKIDDLKAQVRTLETLMNFADRLTVEFEAMGRFDRRRKSCLLAIVKLEREVG